MKAIIEKGITYKVTGEKGAFTITEDVKGKIKMFQTSTIEVVEIEEMPKAKVYKKIQVSSEVAEKNYLRFKANQRESRFQELYFESQRSAKY